MTESDMEQAWECEDVNVFDDADDDDAGLQTPATTAGSKMFGLLL